MPKQLLILLLVTISSFAWSAETLIQGNAFYYRGKEVQICKYTDLFTFSDTVLANKMLEDDGNFKFTIEVSEPGLYLIKVGKVMSHLFVMPGDEYTMVIPEPLEEDRFSPAKEVFVQAEIFEANYRLNYHVTKLEKTINQFFIDMTSDSYNLRSGGKIRTAADSVMNEFLPSFQAVENPYFQRYLHYRMASFELNTRHSRKVIYEKYFSGQPRALDQLSYANAFKLFYNDFLSPKSIHKHSDSAEVLLNNAQLEKLRSLMFTHEFLNSPEEVNLLIATELYELGREKRYPQPLVTSLLEQCQALESDEHYLQLVQNAINILNHLAPGTKTPDFIFADVVGNLYRISEYEGSYIYIQFFDKFDAETVRQMSLMKVLREGYGADIAMFSLSTGESLRRLRDVPSSHDFDWFFGKVGHPDQVREDYDLRALPQYFFLDESLKIVKNPTPPPGARIEKLFAKIWNSRHPNKSVPFKLQPPEVDQDKAEMAPK